MPDRIEVNGRWYVAVDALPERREGPDPYLPLKPMCAEYGIDPHRAYDAVRAGALDAPMPSGASRGRRCRRSEFERWVREGLLRDERRRGA